MRILILATWYLQPDTWHLLLDIWYLMSDTWYMILDNLYLKSYTWYLILVVWYLIYIWYLKIDISYLLYDTWYFILCIAYLLSDTLYLISGVKCHIRAQCAPPCPCHVGTTAPRALQGSLFGIVGPCIKIKFLRFFIEIKANKLQTTNLENLNWLKFQWIINFPHPIRREGPRLKMKSHDFSKQFHCVKF